MAYIFSLIKLHFHLLIFSLIIDFIFINCQDESLNLNGRYVIAFTLSNQNIIIYSTKGFYIFNSDLSFLMYSYNFTSEIIINENALDVYYPSFSQYSDEEGGDILIYFYKTIYLFNSDGIFICKDTLENNIILDNQISYIIIPFQNLNKECYYVLVYISNNIINILYFKINKDNGTNENLIYKFYENKEIHILYSKITCKRVRKNNKYYIICFYSYYKDTKKILGGEIFDAENSFSSVEKIEYEVNDFPVNFKSAVNNDESKVYICYITGSSSFCLYYDIIYNQFSTKIRVANYGKADHFSFNLNFFKITEEFIFSSKNFFRSITISKFDKNMTFISEPHEIEMSNYYSINSFSILYKVQKGKYQILLSSNNNADIRLESFPDSISSVSIMKVPEGYYLINNELKPCNYNCKICNEGPTNISEKCLSCKNNKKVLDENENCICDNYNNYYSLKKLDGTIDEECYTNETKPINFYLNKNNSYFEVCHINCETCEIGGNNEQNNCISCANNFIQRPDSYYSLKYINCVPKCPFYYYITTYNYYICTKNKQCPIEANLLIRNKNKCIDNCKYDDIYKYQYNGECFDKCPIGTSFNGILCKEDNLDKCFSSISEINIPYYNISYDSIEILTKNYVNEFNYLKYKIVKYINDDYSIFIYKNNTCSEELNMPKIDFGGCYEKVQKRKNITSCYY